MDEMLDKLDQIQEMLEQILVITQNQMTVLIGGRDTDEGLDMVEQMATLKGELTTEMEQVEARFQQLYSIHKESIVGSVVSKFQVKIGSVLKLKDEIIEAEQKNVLLLQESLRRYVQRVELPKDPKLVAEAYMKNKK